MEGVVVKIRMGIGGLVVDGGPEVAMGNGDVDIKKGDGSG